LIFLEEVINKMMILHRLRIVQQLFLGAVNNKHGPLAQAKKLGRRIEAFEATFRCWPVDTAFGHMNNAAYVTVAELNRWRMFTELGLFPFILKRKALLVVAEQSIIYIRPILPMREYIISSSLAVTDDKWLHYTHSFEQHPDDVPDGVEPIRYAKVTVKSVLKEYSGKTIKPSELMPHSDFFTELITPKSE
jgi:acyl-CoA thioesterase FadM